MLLFFMLSFALAVRPVVSAIALNAFTVDDVAVISAAVFAIV